MSYWFRPFETIGAFRINALVDFLRSQGSEVLILSVKDTEFAYDGLRVKDSGQIDQVLRLRGFSWASAISKVVYPKYSFCACYGFISSG